jgi:superfamily I DNA and/or RNA helicase
MNSNLENKVEILFNALEAEKQYEVDLYKQNINQLSINDRVNNQTTIYPLNYIDLKFTPFGEQLIEFENQMSFPKLSLGKTVEIFNEENTLRGYIYKINSERFYIKTNSDDRFFEWINKGKVGLNFLPDTKTYDAFLNELKSIRDTTVPHQINFIYNKNRPYHNSKELPNKKELNGSQNQAIQQIINSENPIELVHGPPGTGKTTTITEAINLLTQKGKRILICSSTHIAIDNICQKLIDKNVNVCRIGNPIKVDDNIVNVTLENKAKNDNLFKVVEQLKKQADVIRKKAFKYKRNFDKSAYEERKLLKKELKDIKKDIGKIQKDIYKHTLESSDVICGTFVGVLSELSNQEMFDYVFIDEASKAIEPAIWSVCKFANKIILAGDHHQLPPFVQSNKAIQLGLNISVFDVAQQNNFPLLLLNEQYRMNEKIMNHSNNYFYNSKLIANKMVKDWHLTDETYQPIEFIDTAGCDFQETQENENFGIYNLGEIDIIKKRIELLNLENNNLVIISPYNLQVNWLKKEIPQLIKSTNTIDSFQGQESDVVIISLVRSNDKGTIGFLKDYRRMNVAITRAKKKLIIVGDSTTIGQDKFYNKLLAYIEQKGSYTSAWEYMI